MANIGKAKTFFGIGILSATLHSATLEERVALLEEQNKILTEEVIAIQTGGFTLVDVKKTFSGLGPAASKVYFSQNPLSIGGYGEMFYANPRSGDDYVDVYRLVTYIGYKFSERVILNTEIEFEHGANVDTGGKVAVEFMYLDFLFNDWANLRIGNLLSPLGLINLRHEPTLFSTVQRPEIEKKLIPSTWNENGILLYGRLEEAGIEYTAGVINALNLNSDETKNANNGWIRSARQGSAKNAPFDPAFVGRVDYVGINGLLVGASVYYGEGSNLKNDPSNEVSGLKANMFDLHFHYEKGSFSAYGLYTKTTLTSAEKLGRSAVKQASGYYLNVSYDLSDAIGIPYDTPVFAQYEDFNPVERTVGGFNQSKYETRITTVGFNVFAVDQAVIKVDYAMKDVGGIKSDTFSVGMGFIF